MEAVGFVVVERVVVEDLDVHEPLLEVVGLDEGDSRGEVTLELVMG